MNLNLPEKKVFIGPARMWRRILAFVLDLFVIDFFVLSFFQDVADRMLGSGAGFMSTYNILQENPAQANALFGVFMGVAVQSGVPPTLAALMLLFATNFFSVITPQGSSANVIFAGSGYLTQGEIYRNGGIVTATNLLIFLIIGTPWILIVSR